MPFLVITGMLLSPAIVSGEPFIATVISCSPNLIVPEGKVWHAAEGHTVESHEGRAEDYELAVEVRQAKKLKDAYDEVGEHRSLEDCILEIRRRKAIREGHGNIIDVPGLGNLFNNNK